MIQCGDLFDVLPTLKADSIDACVTDPPYGIGFMGKQWDSFKPGVAEKRIVPNRQIASDNPNLKGRTRAPASSPSAVAYDFSASGLREFQAWTERWAREVYRVLKPGAHLLVCGSPRSFHRMTCGVEDAGFVIRDCFSWLHGQGFPKSLNIGDGRGTALKPGWEPIIMARKPFAGTVAANVLTYGTGALNVDACRLESVPLSVPQPVIGANKEGRTYGYKTGKGRNGEMSQSECGRWPANVLLDEEAARALDEMTGELSSGGTPEIRNADKSRTVYGAFNGSLAENRIDWSRGGASRFFYVAKPDREERTFGCDGSGNRHPTVKPVALMRWLVRLVTPVGGTVLDPFLGSGTTGMACRYEQRGFVGIEREPEYVAISERRIAAVAPLFAEANA